MATVLSVGDIAIIQYNSTGSDSFSFVFLRAVDAGTSINFTDDGWQAAGGFRPGEGSVSYTASAAIAAGTIVTLTGLDLDDAGDQIIAYQGDPATPTILHLVDLADGNTTVAGDATDANTTALPPGFALGVNAVALPLNNSIYAGPIEGSAAELFAAIRVSANWIGSDTIQQIQSPTPWKVQQRPDLDLDANNSTHGGSDYRATITSNGPAVKISDTDINVSDADGTEITKASIGVKGADPGDVLFVNGSLPAGIVATAYDPATGVLTLSGTATHAAYEAAIQQIEFSTTASVGTQKQIEVSVFDGEDWSSEAKAFITVSGTATDSAPPVLDLDANNSNGVGANYTAIFTTGGPEIPVADTDVSITDVDSATIQSARITIAINRQSDDVLSPGALPPGITASSYDSLTGVITLSGAASLADYQTALRQVVFDTTSISTADRIIEVTVNDGTFDSNVGTTYLHVVAPPPNVPPVLDLDANNSTTPGANYLTGFTDGGPAVAVVDTDVLVTDSDDTELTSATVTLTNHDTDDILLFNGAPPPGITASVYDPGTGILTLTGTAPLTAYQAAMQQITFDNTGTTPSTDTRVIDIVVNDGAQNGNTAQAFIQVGVVNNSAPLLDLDPNNSGGSIRDTFRTAFVENGAPVPIADVDTSITDLDSTTLVSATITLTNPQTGDQLTVSGALPGAIAATAYDPVTGVLTLTGLATLAEYEAALQQIAYSSTSDNPVTEDRLIEVMVNDGTNDSNVAAAVISVTATNDAPVIQVDPTAAYVENAVPVLLSPSASLTDADNTDLNFALVQITDGSFQGDGDILSVGGKTSGAVNGVTFLWDPKEHALAFGGASSIATYQALLQTVEFQSTSDNPTVFNASPQRTLTWSVSGGTAFTTATTTIDITAVNDPPQETVAATAAYTEKGSPVTISPDATATDVDDVNLVAGAVRILTGGLDGDLLTVNGMQSGTFSGIEFSYDAGSRALEFTHPTSVADYQAFLQAVQFQSTSDNPTNFGLNPTRTLTWGLFDGENYSSAVQTTEITINAIDDPAVAQNDAVATTENTAITAGNVFANNGFGPDSDPDNVTFSVTAVSGGALGAPFALPSGALLTLNADGTFSYDPNHLFDYLPTPDSGASNLTITDTFSYTITGGDTATVTVTVSGVDTNDVLHDSAGIDSLAGGIGNDVYYVSNTGDVVIEAANAGFDTVAASVNYTLPVSNTVEVLNMLGSGLTGTGTEGAETFISSNGPNTLIGLGGNDTYYVKSTSDVVIEAAGGGIDTVQASVNYTLSANVEGLYMIGSGLTGTGTNNADSLLSSGGPNTLVGLGGDDLYYVNNAADVVVEAPNEGFNSVLTSLSYTLPANVEALYLTGSGLTGTGNSGANTLVTTGANTLVGLGGDDTFVFSAGSANGATVGDFSRGQVAEWDFLVFSGFGTEAQGATFTQIGTTDQWQIHSSIDAHNEVITLTNHAAVHAGDFVFV